MTGYESKRAAAQDKLNDDDLTIAYQSGYYDGKKAAQAAQPAQEFNRTWVCNECGSQQFTSAICEADLDYLACSNCGGDEFHKEALEQPAQEPMAMLFGSLPVYDTAPPQRTWVDLTDDEMWSADYGGSKIINLIYAKAIEAKLKEKNNAA